MSTDLIAMSDVDTETTASVGERDHVKAQQERGESFLKWWVLVDVFVAWNSSWFTTFSAASLETTLIHSLRWDSSQYSYVVACTFGGAIVGPFMLPVFDWILSKISDRIPLSSNHFSQLLLILGQGSFALLLEAYYNDASPALYVLILLSRFTIGLGMGSADAKCQGRISYWFGASHRVNEAFGLLIIGIEIGMMTSRVAFPPFYHMFNREDGAYSMSMPFLLALVVPFTSMIVSLFMENKVQNAKNIFPQYFVETDDNDHDHSVRFGSLQRTRENYASFTATIWVVIVVVVLVNALITVIYSCFEDPLYESFDLSEYNADLVLSASALAVISMQFPASWVMDYFGGSAYWIWLYSTTLTMAMGILAVTACIAASGTHVDGLEIYGVVGIVLFSVLLPFENIYGLQAIASPPQHAQLIASTTTVLFWTVAIVVTNGFGWIRDDTGDYSIALLIMFALSAATWIFTAALIVMDDHAEGPMTRCTDKGCCKRRTSSNTDELAPLLTINSHISF